MLHLIFWDLSSLILTLSAIPLFFYLQFFTPLTLYLFSTNIIRSLPSSENKETPFNLVAKTNQCPLFFLPALSHFLKGIIIYSQGLTIHFLTPGKDIPQVTSLSDPSSALRLNSSITLVLIISSSLAQLLDPCFLSWDALLALMFEPAGPNFSEKPLFFTNSSSSHPRVLVFHNSLFIFHNISLGNVIPFPIFNHIFRY